MCITNLHILFSFLQSHNENIGAEAQQKSDLGKPKPLFHLVNDVENPFLVNS